MDFAAAREAMVERQIAARGITNPALLARVPRGAARSLRARSSLAAFAYDDAPLPIEAGQTISQPYIVALMIDAAGIAPGGRVLEIGAGSGYAAAVMSRIAERVIAIERHAELAGWRPRGCRGSAMTMSGSSMATARAAGRTRRPMTRSSPPPAAAHVPELAQAAARDRRRAGHADRARRTPCRAWSGSCAVGEDELRAGGSRRGPLRAVDRRGGLARNRSGTAIGTARSAQRRIDLSERRQGDGRAHRQDQRHRERDDRQDQAARATIPRPAPRARPRKPRATSRRSRAT